MIGNPFNATFSLFILLVLIYSGQFTKKTLLKLQKLNNTTKSTLTK
jgi:hypothetical protein